MKGHQKHFVAIAAILVLLPVLTAISCQKKPHDPGASGSESLYWISNTGSATVSVLDLDTRKVEKTIDLTKEAGSGNLAKQSHFIAVTNDGKFLLIGEGLGTPDGRILFVDTKTDRVVKKFNVGAGIGLHLSHDGRWLFSVSNGKGTVEGVNYSNVINVFDVDKQEYLGKIDHGSNPHVLDTSWDGRTLYTTTAAGGELVAYDITNLPQTIPQKPFWTFDVFQKLKDDGLVTSQDLIGNMLHALAVHPNDRYVIVGSFDFYTEPLLTGGGDIIVDVLTDQIVARIPGRPHNYDISPDQRYLLCGEHYSPDCEEEQYLHDLGHAEFTGPLVRVINIAELQSQEPDYRKIQVAYTIDAGALGGTGPINHQTYDRSGQYIIVTASGKDGANGHTLIVDVRDGYKLVANLEVGLAPHGITYSGYTR